MAETSPPVFKNKKSSKLWLIGIRDGINVPGFALMSTMTGFASIAREAGFDIWMTLVTTATVFGMPGQVAFASLFAGGASLLLIFVAVSLANMRMMLMVISGSDILKLPAHNLPFWKRLLLMHFLAITSWAQIGFKSHQYPPPLLLTYYIGFSLTIFTFAMIGTLIGFYIADWLPPDILRLVIFVTPLYILLLVVNARQTINRLSAVIGGTLCPLIYPLAADWSILIAGMIGGSLAMFIFHIKGWKQP
ncbi:AzlC family ABC transporter permease [Alphaproteobacteria bacterium]|nr:AzlC family ABC transporter permease [Alphaproteobacteria bacterium]